MLHNGNYVTLKNKRKELKMKILPVVGYQTQNQNKKLNSTKMQSTPSLRASSDVVSFGSSAGMGELRDFVLKNSVRIKPENVQEDAVNLTFFAVKKIGEPVLEEFQRLTKPVKKLIEQANNNELSYLQLGGEMGDQGIALQTMGLGHLLGEWKVLSPETLVPDLPKELKQQMAGMGMVSIIK